MATQEGSTRTSRTFKCPQHTSTSSSGLGTIAKVARGSLPHRLSNNLDITIGWNLHKVIMASYRWLSDNYQAWHCLVILVFVVIARRVDPRTRGG
ncbi:hypothetical protein EV363DRAFT_1379549 [Boletus edulis]|nr:hypothetical protein EV363DRAFT_1379549 [Boletus edulis]